MIFDFFSYYTQYPSANSNRIWIPIRKLVLFVQKIWYKNTCTNESATIGTCQNNTVIYLVSNMQYLITAFAFSVSKPFRKPLYTNVLLTLFMIIAFAYSVYIIVIPDKISRKILQIFDFNTIENNDANNFKYYLIGFTLINFCLSYITESALIPAMTKCYIIIYK